MKIIRVIASLVLRGLVYENTGEEIPRIADMPRIELSNFLRDCQDAFGKRPFGFG